MAPSDQQVIPEKRFEFGKNWSRFLSMLNDDRIAGAENSLKNMLGLETLAGRTFLDVGSGSGLFSLAAMRLGAASVRSFDYDPHSVACAQELKRRYFPQAENWTVEQGDVLDADYLRSLGQWDIVYSWGVLHHTGHMWQALHQVAALVREGGLLFVSVYNDQGIWSKFWEQVKLLYNRDCVARWFVTATFMPCLILRAFAVDLLRRQNPLRRYRNSSRGMSALTDMVDWLGGYPFEVAKPEQIFDLYREEGFELRRLQTCAGKAACNEFVFAKPCSTSCS